MGLGAKVGMLRVLMWRKRGAGVFPCVHCCWALCTYPEKWSGRASCRRWHEGGPADRAGSQKRAQGMSGGQCCYTRKVGARTRKAGWGH